MINVDFLSIFLGGCGSLMLYPLLHPFFRSLSRKRRSRAVYTAAQIIKKARCDAEAERKNALNHLKEELHRKRSEADFEVKKAQLEIERLQNACQKKEMSLKERNVEICLQQERVQEQERILARRLDKLDVDEHKLKRIYQELVNKLERVSGLTKGEAKTILIESLEEEVKLDRRQWIAKMEEEARLTAKERSGRILIGVMQRYLSDIVTLHSSSIIHLPNEEMKGRIIGKEGRNIKALEMATGMEFVIGDAPEIITISGFNPMRREIARRTLEKLMLDGRINPTRIEEAVVECEKELDAAVEEMGQQAILEFGLTNVHPEMVVLLGKLHFRTSFTQDVLLHSKEVACFARMLSYELGLDAQLAVRCGLFHDIGKAVSAEVEGPHAVVGADLAKEYGESSIVVNAIASHHNDVSTKTLYDLVIQIADGVSAARPGARRETLTTYIKRLEQLEDICHEFEGVKKSYALQAGREVRVIVDESAHDDSSALLLARDIAKKIEGEMNFPGQIKVSVIRETRVIEYAR